MSDNTTDSATNQELDVIIQPGSRKKKVIRGCVIRGCEHAVEGWGFVALGLQQAKCKGTCMMFPVRL